MRAWLLVSNLTGLQTHDVHLRPSRKCPALAGGRFRAAEALLIGALVLPQEQPSTIIHPMLSDLVNETTDWELADAPEESESFGINIQRLVIRSDGYGEWLPAVQRSTADVIFVRYPSTSTCIPAALASTNSSLINAGALVYWSVDARVLHASVPSDGPFNVSPATSSELSQIDHVIRAVFRDYSNHYMCNPLLTRTSVATGYATWASKLLRASSTITVVARSGGQIAGVAICSIDDSDVEVVLAGVLPAYRRLGAYSALLAGVPEAAAAEPEGSRTRISRLLISTQLHNVLVQGSWARLGLRPLATFETVHLVNPRLLDLPAFTASDGAGAESSSTRATQSEPETGPRD